MKVFALWHGGSSYSVGGLESLEKFDSLAAAKEEFYERYHYSRGYFQYAEETEYITSGSTGTPTVSESASMEIFLVDIWVNLFELYWARANGDLYPDRVISFGPQMGVRIERT